MLQLVCVAFLIRVLRLGFAASLDLLMRLD